MSEFILDDLDIYDNEVVIRSTHHRKHKSHNR